jgi:ABC-type sugar transport system ATPase subunit
MSLSFEGRDLNAVPRQGTVHTDDPLAAVRKFWPHNWQSVKFRNRKGQVVGAIGTLGGRERCWAIIYTGDPGREES